MSLVNQFFTDEFTDVIQRLVKEVVNDPKTYLGSRLLPSVAVPVKKIRTEVIESTGGLTLNHLPGTAPKYIQSFGTRVEEFSPPAYKEAIHYDEDKILWLRELGNNMRNVRGVQKYIELDIDRLNRRIEARVEFERWNALFTGGFTYLGKTFSYGFPAQNRVTPIGAVWSLDGINFNSAANPLLDIRYWVEGGYAPFRKYKIAAMWMNPNTARWILDNQNTRTFISSIGGNPNIMQWDLETILNFVIPGAPNPVVYNGWYQTESLVDRGDGVADKIQTSNAIYFIPDGQIFFELTGLPGNDKIGEFVQGVHLSAGTINDPGFGKFLVVDDCTAPGTRGGPSNPFVDLIGGVYGGVNLYRPFDTLTAQVL
jgi:hypothetical protein